jgi:dTDP-4-dehydrorhamnose reductase
MRVTIFGAAGLLGKALMREWQDDQVTGLDIQDGDLRDPEQVEDMVQRTQPDWIVLTAAYTDVDACESNREMAFDVNCRAAVNVARAAKQHRSRLLFLSTDYVFDGTKRTPYEVDDSRSPRSVYGQSKADAEVQLMEVSPNCCITRTSWMFGMSGKSFPDTILKLASTRPELDVVNDQRGSPTYSVDLARAIVQLCRKNAEGIVHATNSGECTWFDFAREIVSGAGLPTIVRPTSSDKFVRPAERPKYSVLSPRSLNRYGIIMPSWQDALRRYLAQRTAQI